ncbi:LAME_0G18074g1_1 [Lachancea meyersii CBS 8951]|uniref:Palmitoyltransferase n=1 Tax=Lachancea meyersii CBS 8951 TaxID=1266667 RepID=A0A1G4KBQ3_9SACH|nr:LAME_0G18074g1_1 [Lachancea meyersii CBS 8951]
MATLDTGKEVENLSVSESQRASISSIEPIPPSNDGEVSEENISLTNTDNQSGALDATLNKYREACQTGDLVIVKKMVESGVIDLKHDYSDEDRVSGLHWACINNRLGVVKYLISNGADVNFAGGKLDATPLHWAARYGYVYIVHYLLERGADPKLVDQQGFNVLHLSINSSNVMLVLYALFFIAGDELSIDALDPNNRTPLLWAAYQGDSLSVKALLEFKANSSIVDSGGFSPLHWATVKGQIQVIKALIDDGADVFQKTNDNKDCFIISKEMNTTESLSLALLKNGLKADGTPLVKYFSNPHYAKFVTFMAPFVLLGVIFKLFASINFLLALLLSLLSGFAAAIGLKKLVLPSFISSSGSGSFFKTPFWAGILLGSLLWVLYVWLARVFIATFEEEPFINLAFLFFATVCIISFFKLLSSNPGKIVKEENHDKIKETIQELLRVGKFDARHFCIETYVRKPLRSKYSRFNNALITRFDHFCPWVYNDIGLRNHKLFLYFLSSLIVGAICFAKACMEYFDVLEDASNSDFKCMILDDELCAGLHIDPFALFVMAWACLQVLWVSCLLTTQLFQTIKGITSYELNEKSRERHGQNEPSEFFMTTPTDLMDRDELSALNQGTVNSNDRRLMKPRTCFSTLCGLTGLDQLPVILSGFFGSARGQQDSIQTRVGTGRFATNNGWKTNLKDFWLLSDQTAPLWQRLLYSPQGFKASYNNKEVDYRTLYTLPETTLPQEDMV